MKRLFGESVDPVTGDHLTAGEHVSWMVQGVMRRWSFLSAIVLLTAVCWLTNNQAVLLWWNLGASLAALLIEGITAMALINQTKRDALVSRETRAISRRLEQIASVILKDVVGIEEKLQVSEPVAVSHDSGATSHYSKSGNSAYLAPRSDSLPHTDVLVDNASCQSGIGPDGAVDAPRVGRGKRQSETAAAGPSKVVVRSSAVRTPSAERRSRSKSASNGGHVDRDQ